MGLWSKIASAAGSVIGYLEKYTPFRYPVHKYQEQVTPDLWRGSRVDRAGVEDLICRGFKTIVDLCAEYTPDDELQKKYVAVKFVHIPIIDNTTPTNEQAEKFINLFKDTDNLPAFVHCEAGEGRTGTMVALYRIRIQGWTADAAIQDGARHHLCMPNQLEFIRKFK